MKSIHRSGVLRVYRFPQGNGKRLDLTDHWESLAEQLLAGQAYSSSRALQKEETSIGWIDTDLYYAGDYAAFVWEVTKRRIPKSAIEELLNARIRSMGLEKVSRKIRTELKEDVTQDLLQRALPDKRDHIAALNRHDGTLYVQGLSLKHARTLANWVRRQMQAIGLDAGVPCEVLAELPAAVVDQFATWARGEETRGLWKLGFDARTTVVSDARGSVKVSNAQQVLGEEEEADSETQVRESLLDIELQVSGERQITGCRVDAFDGNDIVFARYVFSAKKPPVIALPANSVGVGAQLVELIQAWTWVYEQTEAMLSTVRLHVSDKEHDHQRSLLLRPFAE